MQKINEDMILQTHSTKRCFISPVHSLAQGQPVKTLQEQISRSSQASKFCLYSEFRIYLTFVCLQSSPCDLNPEIGAASP